MNSKSFLSKSFAHFKEMPLLLKIIFIGSLFAIVEALFDIIQMKPILFDYFNSGFPKNFPVIWYAYSILINIFAIIVYLKRSYSLLKKYLYLTVGLLVIAFLNSAYSINFVPAEQKTAMMLMYAAFYIVAGLLVVYHFKQKKYFNQV